MTIHINIIRDERKDTGFITAIIENRWVMAKVYNEPSEHGVNGGRVSKLSIGRTSTRNADSPFFEQMAYNWDRGLDFHHKHAIDSRTFNRILKALESLPEVK